MQWNADMSNGGRPPLTALKSEAILKSIEKRVPYEIAAKANGIAPSTIYYWLQRAEEDMEAGIESDYTRFSEALNTIEQNKIINQVDTIDRAPERWQANAWILERRWAKYFGQNAALRDLAADIDELKNLMKGKSHAETNDT